MLVLQRDLRIVSENRKHATVLKMLVEGLQLWME